MILVGDASEKLNKLGAESVYCCVTSPPYWGLRDYGSPGQLGLEKTPEEYVSKMVDVFREVKRVLRDDGTLWLNLGDSYSGNGGQYGDAKSTLGGRKQSGTQGAARFKKTGLKPKDLVGIPWRVAFALQSDGWYLRQDIIWHKPNPMPESVRDRCTKSHEYIFLLSKSRRYYFDNESILEPYSEKRTGSFRPRGSQESTRAKIGSPSQGNSGGYPQTRKGKNKRSVWVVRPKPFKGAHFATFPPDLIEPCVLAGCPKGGTVLDPFFGAGTTGVVAIKHQREFIGIELSKKYADMAAARLTGVQQEMGV